MITKYGSAFKKVDSSVVVYILLSSG